MNLPKDTKVKALKAINILSESRKVGDEVLVDANTAENLVRKGWVEIINQTKEEQAPVVETKTKGAKGK